MTSKIIFGIIVLSFFSLGIADKKSDTTEQPISQQDSNYYLNMIIKYNDSVEIENGNQLIDKTIKLIAAEETIEKLENKIVSIRNYPASYYSKLRK